MNSRQRTYSLGVWGLGLGYFLFYTPYSGVTKAISAGLFAGLPRKVAGLALLPGSVLATFAGVIVFFTLAGWWRYAGRLRVAGCQIPCPGRWTLLSGLCSGTIIGTTTLAFTFSHISVVLTLVLLRGGVLVIAPIVDALAKRRVRWFSWAAMGLSLAAVLAALSATAEFDISPLAGLVIAAYLAAYFFRFQIMTKLAKCRDEDVTRRFLVEEQMIATPALIAALALAAVFGPADAAHQLRIGFACLAGSDLALPAAIAGFSYAGLLICTSLIFLDRRENTFCVPIHCGSSMLAGIVAAYGLSYFSALPPPSLSQLLGAALIMVALLFLSPLHHLSVTELRATLARWLPNASLLPPPVPAPAGTPFQRLFLFICAGNTSRSPMAQAICNAELARRLNLSWEAVGPGRIRAISAGLAPREGAPMTPESCRTLEELGVRFAPHTARFVTAEMVRDAEMVFCMTQKLQRQALEHFPAAGAKMRCLDPDGDIEDPTGGGASAYARCARRIQELVGERLSELGIPATPLAQTPT